MIQVGYWQSLTHATGTADAAAVLMVILLGCSVSALGDCGLLLRRAGNVGPWLLLMV